MDNCEFSYLGKGGVLLSGRGPGYGDVNTNNRIVNSHFNRTSQIKWDAAAVHIDQSSSNLIKQNYFEDIPMSAVIVSGCRESNIMEKESDPGAVINRDFHWAEIYPDLVSNPNGASAFFYDENNIIEENVFRAVHIGVPELIPTVVGDPPGFCNGMIYTTGRKAGSTDYFNRNYFFDVNPNDTDCHTWVILGDGHEDYSDFHQNMMVNLRMFNDFESPALINQNCNDGGNCRATANVSLNCTHDGLEGAALNTSYAGNVNFDSSNPGGSADFVNDYKEMYDLLASGQLPGPDPLPGSMALMEKLYQLILKYDPNWTQVKEIENNHPVTYELSQNYPNPFNPETTIEFGLPAPVLVEISIYDINGKLVRALISGERRAGKHWVKWDSRDDHGIQVSSGMYFYFMKVRDSAKDGTGFNKTKKMILMK